MYCKAGTSAKWQFYKLSVKLWRVDGGGMGDRGHAVVTCKPLAVQTSSDRFRNGPQSNPVLGILFFNDLQTTYQIIVLWLNF